LTLLICSVGDDDGVEIYLRDLLLKLVMAVGFFFSQSGIRGKQYGLLTLKPKATKFTCFYLHTHQAEFISGKHYI
jgi:hypothetical protein